MNRLIFHDEKFPRRKLIVLDFSASLGGAENGKKYRKIEIKIKKQRKMNLMNKVFVRINFVQSVHT